MLIFFLVSLLEEHADENHLAGGEGNQEMSTTNKDSPAHARKPKQQENGMCWSFHFALYFKIFCWSCILYSFHMLIRWIQNSWTWMSQRLQSNYQEN